MIEQKIYLNGIPIDCVKIADKSAGFVRRYICKDEANYKWAAASQGTERPTEMLYGIVSFTCPECGGVGGMQEEPMDCDECGAVGTVHAINSEQLECCECGHLDQNWNDCKLCEGFGVVL